MKKCIEKALDLIVYGDKSLKEIVQLEFNSTKSMHEKGPPSQFGKIFIIENDVDNSIVSDSDASSEGNRNNLFVKICFIKDAQGGTSTHVKDNVLTFIFSDVFEKESLNLLCNKNYESCEQLKQKISNKTALFFDREKAKFFAEKYSEAGYIYEVKHIIVHELVHFMQYKMGDFKELASLSAGLNKKIILDNFSLLEKYKNSFVRYLVNVNDSFMAIKQLKSNDAQFSNKDDSADAAILALMAMREKIIEESAVLGSQWEGNNINEWKILYGRHLDLPFRYPYTEIATSVFTLDEAVGDRMINLVFGADFPTSEYKQKFARTMVDIDSEENEKFKSQQKEERRKESEAKDQFLAKKFQKGIDTLMNSDPKETEELIIKKLKGKLSSGMFELQYNAWLSQKRESK
ncbi:MAG: hypothetical protein Q8S21_06600 [Candidatus Paracaedibacteraceae bacterium]|nr:hypothetical protein [Candidatus Paracaedibacteraceae bacterium]